MKFYLKCILLGTWAFALHHTNIFAQFYHAAMPSAQTLTKESYITPEMQWAVASLMNPQATMNINKETGALDHAPSVESMIQNINTQLYISSAQKESAIKALNTMLEATEIALFKIKMKAAYHDQNYIAMFSQLTAELNNQKMAIQATLNSVKSRSAHDQASSSGSYFSWIFGESSNNNQVYQPNSMTTINPHHGSVLHIPADLAESIVKNFNFKTMPDSTQAANLLFKQCFIAQQQHEANRIPLNVNQQISANNYIYTNFPDIYSKYSNSYPICQKVQDLVVHEPIRNNVALPVTEKQRQAYHLLLQIRQSVQLALDIANKKSSVNLGSYLPSSLVSYLDGVVAELTKYDAYLNNLCKNPQFGATAQDVQDTAEWSTFTKVAAGVAVTAAVVGTMWYFGDNIKEMNPWATAPATGTGVTETAVEKEAKRKQRLADIAALDVNAEQQLTTQNNQNASEASTPRKKRIPDDFYENIANHNAQSVYGPEISEAQLDTIEREGRETDRLQAEKEAQEEAEIIRRAEESAKVAAEEQAKSDAIMKREEERIRNAQDEKAELRRQTQMLAEIEAETQLKAEQDAKEVKASKDAEELVAQQNALKAQQFSGSLTNDVSTLINNNAASTESAVEVKPEFIGKAIGKSSPRPTLKGAKATDEAVKPENADKKAEETTITAPPAPAQKSWWNQYNPFAGKTTEELKKEAEKQLTGDEELANMPEPENSKVADVVDTVKKSLKEAKSFPEMAMNTLANTETAQDIKKKYKEFTKSSADRKLEQEEIENQKIQEVNSLIILKGQAAETKINAHRINAQKPYPTSQDWTEYRAYQELQQRSEYISNTQQENLQAQESAAKKQAQDTLESTTSLKIAHQSIEQKLKTDRDNAQTALDTARNNLRDLLQKIKDDEAQIPNEKTKLITAVDHKNKIDQDLDTLKKQRQIILDKRKDIVDNLLPAARRSLTTTGDEFKNTVDTKYQQLINSITEQKDMAKTEVEKYYKITDWWGTQTITIKNDLTDQAKADAPKTLEAYNKANNALQALAIKTTDKDTVLDLMKKKIKVMGHDRTIQIKESAFYGADALVNELNAEIEQKAILAQDAQYNQEKSKLDEAAAQAKIAYDKAKQDHGRFLATIEYEKTKGVEQLKRKITTAQDNLATVQRKIDFRKEQNR